MSVNALDVVDTWSFSAHTYQNLLHRRPRTMQYASDDLVDLDCSYSPFQANLLILQIICSNDDKSAHDVFFE